MNIEYSQTRAELQVGNQRYRYFSLQKAAAQLGDLSRLPISLKILLENLLRHEDGVSVDGDDIRALAAWLNTRSSEREIQYRPARVLMQDFTGVPAVVDFEAARGYMAVRALRQAVRARNRQVPSSSHRR